MRTKCFTITGLFLIAAILSASFITFPGSSIGGTRDPYWDVVPEEENPSQFYASILYSDIGPRLREIEVTSNRVKVDVIGRSAGGRDLFLVTLSKPETLGRLGEYQAIRRTMLEDPDKAQEMIEKFGDFKVPVFINGSIHGDEYPGTDAAIRLIETLAYQDTETVQTILENVILLVNVVQNPDGRVIGTRSNVNGFDINRDFIAQSQPETRAAVKVFTEWNPMVVLDLHGFITPMLIEPCTPPHNPNYEYDLYIKWALYEAEAMEAELFEQTGLDAQIPYRDDDLGWDDWPLSYAPMYAMYHGAYGHTLETPSEAWGELTVDAHYAAVWGSLKYVAQNRLGMIHDQIEIFRRGYLDLLQQPIPPELLPAYPQYQELMIQEFPAAYVIPLNGAFQTSPHQPARLVDFLLFNDVRVEQATQSFVLDGVEYPAGTYIVWMDQPKRGLANVILDDGLDLSGIPELYFYSPPSVWSHPRMWGVERAVMTEKIAVPTEPVQRAVAPKGSVEAGDAVAYAYLPTSIAAFRATNDLLARGIGLYRIPAPFTDAGRSFGAGAVTLPGEPELANEVATGYALEVFALEKLPDGAVPMYRQRVAVYGDEGVRHSMDTLGFDYDPVDRSDLNAGIISGYHVFINRGLGWSSLTPKGRAAFADWFAAGGDYVGLGYGGGAIDFAVDAGRVDVAYESIGGNAIVKVDFAPDDSVAAGFREKGHAFVYNSVWFTAWPEAMEISASIDSGDFLLSGFWEDWQGSGAGGMPVILHDAGGPADVTLIGINNTFRGHPENTFRILGNAVYNGLD